MKKIMLNDNYGLTQAVIDGTKTQTRRMPSKSILQRCRILAFSEKGFKPERETRCAQLLLLNATYCVGEEIAVAQSYESMANEGGAILASMMQDETSFKSEYCGAGWNNKMFVRADLMPHRIKITNIRVERLQDISEEDCLKEGVREHPILINNERWYVCPGSALGMFPSARKAFAALLDKISGQGTWASNPWVFVYDFELVK